MTITPQYITKCTQAYKTNQLRIVAQLNCNQILKYCSAIDSSLYRGCSGKKECDADLEELKKNWRNKLLDDGDCQGKSQHWCPKIAAKKAVKCSALENAHQDFLLAQPDPEVKVAGLSSPALDPTEDL